MRPHLVVDCTLEEIGMAIGLRELLPAAPVHAVRAADGELPESAAGWASILVSGSQACVRDERDWLAPLFELLRDAARRGTPVLGFCFGHQAIARALCGPDAVRRASRSELGWVEIERRPGAPLFAGLPARFPSFVSHFDEVRPGLRELELLARSERCEVQAFRARGTRMVGLQFHPELPPALCEQLVRAKLALHGYLGDDPAPVLARAFDARPLGRALVASFLERVAAAPLAHAPGRRRAG